MNSFCTEKECKFRHPKPCKYREKCKFFKFDKCFYKHDSTRSSHPLFINKQKALEEDSKKLKVEILDLQNKVKSKE